MGLAIVHALLIAHGGSIQALSSPGKGAILRFWVPLVEEEPNSESIARQDAAARVPEADN
jgi:signal transduction histidine kinase